MPLSRLKKPFLISSERDKVGFGFVVFSSLYYALLKIVIKSRSSGIDIGYKKWLVTLNFEFGG